MNKSTLRQIALMLEEIDMWDINHPRVIDYKTPVFFETMRVNRKKKTVNLEFYSCLTGNFVLSIPEEDAIALMEKLIKFFEKKKKYKYPYEGGRKK